MKRTNRPTFPYTSQSRNISDAGKGISFNYRNVFKILPVILIIGIGLFLGSMRGPSGSAARLINDMGGEHKKILEKAYSMIISKDFTGAANLAASVIFDDPENPLAHHIMGLANARRGLTEEAAVSFRKACELNPNFAPAWFNLGVIEETRGLFENSLAAYTKAAELEPGNMGFADAKIRMERIVLGETDWDMSMHEAENMFLDGIAALSRGSADDLVYAENTFRALAEQRPYDMATLNMLGLSLARQGKLDEAEAVFLQVTIAEPGYSDAWYNLGMVHSAQGKIESAIDAFSKARDMSSLETMKQAALREISRLQAELESAKSEIETSK